jgi:hypothetical protein
MNKAKKIKGYRIGDTLKNDQKIVRFINLPHLGFGRHQIVTDADYTNKNKVILDSDINKFLI